MDYKEKYEMALEGIQEILGSGEDSIKMSRLQQRLQGIFPELKESEDERIRKELLEHCKNQAKPYIQTGNKCPQIQSWISWLEKQRDKDKLIQELGEYKVKYTQETLEKALTMNNKDDERLRKTTIAFLKEFADKGYENAVECIAWIEKQGGFIKDIDDVKSNENGLIADSIKYKNKPKFKVDDFIGDNNGNVYKVVGVCNLFDDEYRLKNLETNGFLQANVYTVDSFYHFVKNNVTSS